MKKIKLETGAICTQKKKKNGVITVTVKLPKNNKYE